MKILMLVIALLMTVAGLLESELIYGENKMVDLTQLFARTVKEGWRPRTPAFEPEVRRLTASRVRGDCVAPLARPDDIVYLDPSTPAEPGDLVSFALSERGAAAQNSALPEGQSPARPGDRWLELLAEDHGYPTLLDRHGRFTTVSFLGAEHPDDPVPLAPVRNIRRGVCLVFVPDTHASGLGINAATTVSETTTGGVNLPTGGVTVPVVSQSMGPYVAEATVVVTVSGTLSATNTSTTVEWSPWYYYQLATTSGTLDSPARQITSPLIAVSSSASLLFTYEKTFTLPAGTTATYYLNMQCSNVLTSFDTTEVATIVLKAEAIYK
jgi:hypothetical protein